MALAAAEGVFRHAPLAERLRRGGVPEPLVRHRIAEGQRGGGWWSIVGTFPPKVMKPGGIHRALEVGGEHPCSRDRGLRRLHVRNLAGTCRRPHLMVAVPVPIQECDFNMAACYATNDAPTEPFPASGGRVSMAQGPGIGVPIESEALGRHALGEPLS